MDVHEAQTGGSELLVHNKSQELPLGSRFRLRQCLQRSKGLQPVAQVADGEFAPDEWMAHCLLGQD